MIGAEFPLLNMAKLTAVLVARMASFGIRPDDCVPGSTTIEDEDAGWYRFRVRLLDGEHFDLGALHVQALEWGANAGTVN